MCSNVAEHPRREMVLHRHGAPTQGGNPVAVSIAVTARSNMDSRVHQFRFTHFALPWQRLYFVPDPHGHGSFGRAFATFGWNG